MTIRSTITLLTLTIALCSFALSQGLYWESSTTSPMLKQKTLRSTFTYMPGMMRQESSENGSATIFRLDRKLIISINERNKTYSEMSFDDIESAMKNKGAGIDKRLEAMQEKLKNLPEEQRKMMEKAMGGTVPGREADAPVTVTKTSATKTISGFACSQYHVRQGDKTVMTLWVTRDVSGYAAMQQELQDFGRRMAAMNPVNGKSMAAAMKQVEGFPILTEMGETLTTTVTKVERRTTRRSAFEVPAGFQKTASPFLQP